MPPEAAKPGGLTARLGQAIGLSRRMLESAAAGDWSAVAALEAERAALLDEATLAACRRLPQDLRAGVGELLSQCLRLNDELAELTDLHVRELREVVILHLGASTATAAQPSAPAGGGV